MGLLDWEPSARVAFWGKRAVLGIICGFFWAIELLGVAVVLGTLTHTVHPGIQGIQDWTSFLFYLGIWTPLTVVVTYAVRGEWPRRGAAQVNLHSPDGGVKTK